MTPALGASNFWHNIQDPQFRKLIEAWVYMLYYISTPENLMDTTDLENRFSHALDFLRLSQLSSYLEVIPKKNRPNSALTQFKKLK